MLGFRKGKPNTQVGKNEQGDLRVHGFDLEVFLVFFEDVWRSWDGETAAGMPFLEDPCAFFGGHI